MSTAKQNKTVKRRTCQILPMEYEHNHDGTDIGFHYWYNVKFLTSWGQIQSGSEYAMVAFHPTMGRIDIFLNKESKAPIYTFLVGLKILGVP